MRFTTAWSGVSAQNVVLRFALATLTVALTALTYSVTRLSFRDPLMIERGCMTKSLINGKDEARSARETEAFAREASAMRFDTETELNATYFVQDELLFRRDEQLELKKREMIQKLVVSAVTLNGSTAEITTDRLIGVGSVKTVLPFQFTLHLSSQSRSSLNPYGLVITRVEAKKTPNATGDTK